MDFLWLSSTCDFIILIGALVLAFDRIIKPILFLKKRTNTSFEEKITDTLKKFLPDIMRNYFEEAKQQIIKDTTDKVMSKIKDELTQVELLEQQYNILVLTAKDVLREKIMKIYNDFRRERKIPLSKKEQLEQYYVDYKKLNGNSYIDKYYNRIQRWEVIEDDEDEEEDR